MGAEEEEEGEEEEGSEGGTRTLDDDDDDDDVGARSYDFGIGYSLATLLPLPHTPPVVGPWLGPWLVVATNDTSVVLTMSIILFSTVSSLRVPYTPSSSSSSSSSSSPRRRRPPLTGNDDPRGTLDDDGDPGCGRNRLNPGRENAAERRA